MGIVTGIVGWLITSPIGQALGRWIVREFSDEIKALVAAHEQKVADQNIAQQSVKQLQQATTGDQIDKASDSAVTGL